MKIRNEVSVAITGGSGFIGTYVRELLATKGFRIFNFDLVAPTHTVTGETYVACDINDAQDFEKKWVVVDYVVHLAALVGVMECQESPPFSTNVNLIGTQNVCERVRLQNHVCPIVYSSSSAVYGNAGNTVLPITETTELSPLSFYGAQKKWSEELIKQYVKDFGLKTTVLRFFNVFGSGQKFSSPYSGVISKFCFRLGSSQAIELYNNGENTRDFVHVKDVAQAIYKSMIRDYEKEASRFQILNIGSGRKTSVLQIAKQLLEIAKSKGLRPEVNMKEARTAEITHSLASIHNAKEILDWTPTEQLEGHMKEIFERIQLQR